MVGTHEPSCGWGVPQYIKGGDNISAKLSKNSTEPGGAWDGSLRVFSINKGKEVFASVRHTDVITCVAIDQDGLFVMTGSKDTTAVVWEITVRADGGCSARSVQVLCGHQDQLTSVSIAVCLDMAVTASKDGE